MACKHTWQFLSKLSVSSLSLESGLRTFLSEWRHSCSRIVFVIQCIMVAQFTMLHSSFGTEITITAIRCGHPGQNKTSALEKVEKLKKLERIGGLRLQTRESKMSERNRCHWCAGDEYSQKNWAGVCDPLPKTLTLFMTKICDIPCLIYDLTKNSKPYLWPDSKIKTLFQAGLWISSLLSLDQC